VAIALQHTDREDFVDEFWGFEHAVQYSIGRTGFRVCVTT
jgi:hypothetical protein